MAFTDLTSDWQTELTAYHKIPKPVIEVIIDPDDTAITLTGFYDIKTLSAINSPIDISPERIESLELLDLQAVFNDPNGFFNSWENRSGEYQPFRSIIQILLEATTATEARFKPDMHMGNFKAGDLVTFTDGNNIETVKALTASSYFDLYGGLDHTPYITFNSGVLSHTYLENEWAITKSISGLDVLIRLRFDGIDVRLNLFRGVIRSPFNWQKGQSVLTVNNRLGEFLKKEMRLHASSTSPTQRTNTSGSLATSLAWNTGSSGTCSGVTTYTGAQIGEWVVTFSDNTNFTVNGANCKDKAGTTGANFFDQTNATDSQIQIPSANWGGTRATDDTLTFYISANFENKTVPEIIYELLGSYAGVSDDYIDVGGTGVTDTSERANYSFNKAYYVLSTESISISFDQPITIGEAIITVNAHAMAYLTQMTGGNFRLFLLNPQYQFPSYGHDRNEIMDIQNYRTEYINEFIINYGWDYTNGEYQYTYTYPPSDNENPSYQYFGKKRTHTIEMPGMYSSTDAETWAKRYYFTWFMGVNLVKMTGSLYFVNINAGDLVEMIPSGFNNWIAGGADPEGLVISTSKQFLSHNKVDVIMWIPGENYNSIW